MTKNTSPEDVHKHFDGGGNDKHAVAKMHLRYTTYHNGRPLHNFGQYCITRFADIESECICDRTTEYAVVTGHPIEDITEGEWHYIYNFANRGAP